MPSAMTDDQYYKLGSKKDFREAVLTSLNQVRRMIPEVRDHRLQDYPHYLLDYL